MKMNNDSNSNDDLEACTGTAMDPWKAIDVSYSIGREVGKLRIISMLWSSIYDLLLYIQGSRKKPLEKIEEELDAIEMLCRPYAGTEDGYADFLREEGE